MAVYKGERKIDPNTSEKKIQLRGKVRGSSFELPALHLSLRAKAFGVTPSEGNMATKM